jgi:hypothetical protein
MTLPCSTMGVFIMGQRDCIGGTGTELEVETGVLFFECREVEVLRAPIHLSSLTGQALVPDSQLTKVMV